MRYVWGLGIIYQFSRSRYRPRRVMEDNVGMVDFPHSVGALGQAKKVVFLVLQVMGRC